MSEGLKPNVYWVGKCDSCCYAYDFSILPSLYWRCDKYNEPMYAVRGKCPGNIYYKNKSVNDSTPEKGER